MGRQMDGGVGRWRDGWIEMAWIYRWMGGAWMGERVDV